MSQELIGIYRALKKAYGPQRWWPAETPFEMIVGAILTQNTAWTNVEHAISNLRSAKLLTARKMSKCQERQLAKHLRPAGYFNIKARRLKNFLNFLSLKYHGKLHVLLGRPAILLREELLAVNGIGPETADSIILYAAKKPIFVIDAYTKRIFSRIGVFQGAESYDHIQAYFVSKLSLNVKLFNEFHALIVEHAKRFCKTEPVCSPCSLRLDCQYARRRNEGSGKLKKRSLRVLA